MACSSVNGMDLKKNWESTSNEETAVDVQLGLSSSAPVSLASLWQLWSKNDRQCLHLYLSLLDAIQDVVAMLFNERGSCCIEAELWIVSIAICMK